VASEIAAVVAAAVERVKARIETEQPEFQLD